MGLCVIIAAQSQQWQSRFVGYNKAGKLTYQPEADGSLIPDFSRVGYRAGETPIPQLPVAMTLSPENGNDEKNIQQAIDKLSAAPADAQGFRGVILLKKGIYRIGGTLQLKGGIVLRGEGDSTVLLATGRKKRNLIEARGQGQRKIMEATEVKITDKYVPVGVMSFTVADVSQFRTGDEIILRRPGTAAWIHDLKMDRIEVRDSTSRQWGVEEYNLDFERVITKIEGKRLWLDYPVVMAMEDKYGGGSIMKYNFEGRIANVGIENLRCDSEFEGPEDEEHGWTAILYNRIRDSWVRNVTATHFAYSCVHLDWLSRNITVDSCRSLSAVSKITGGRRYSFNNDGQLNLVMNCYASDGRHDYVTGARVCGPNVFYNCKAENTHADTGPHHRWAVGTLYDNVVTDGEINAQDRGNWGTGHGWSGVNQYFWNCRAARAAIQSPWTSGKNYVIGTFATKYPGRLPGRPDATWEGQNKPGLSPVSLYKAQLEHASKPQ